MDGLSSKMTSPDLPPADQEKQTVGQAFSTPLGRQITQARDGDRHVAESARSGFGELGCVPATEGAEVTKPSPPHKRRSLMAFMSFRKSKEPGKGLAPPSPSLPPASTDTGTPHPGFVASPPAATAPVSSAPPALASSPGSRNVDHGSTACAFHSPPGTHQEPVRTTTSAPSAPSAPCPPSPPALHPSFIAFLQEAAIVKAAQDRLARTALTGTNSLWPQVQRFSPAAATTSTPVSASPRANCGHAICVSAAQAIRDVRRAQSRLAGVNATYGTDYDIAEPIQEALKAAYQVLFDCEYETVMAGVGKVAAMMQEVCGEPVNNQQVLPLFLRSSGVGGIQTSAAPAPVAVTGTLQRQPVHAGGVSMHDGACAPAVEHTPVVGHASAPVNTPATVHTPAAGYMPAAGFRTARMNAA